MSAFLVTKAHIDVLVTAAQRFDRYDAVPPIPTAALTADPVAFRRLVEPLPYVVGSEPVWRARSVSARGLWTCYADELGRGLWLANAVSICARYGERAEEAAGVALDELRAYRHTPAARGAVHVIKACHCFAYQASEVADWDNSWAKRAVDELEAAAVQSLPGYDAAPWGESDAA